MEKSIVSVVFLTVGLFGAATLVTSCDGKKAETKQEDVTAEDKEDTGIEINDIKLLNLDGSAVNMAALKNKIVFINFWATWCQPCIQEMPTIAKTQEILKDKNVVFLFASNEEISQITKFKESKQFPFQYVQLQNMEALNIQAIPTTFIFNSEGKLNFSGVGYRNWNTPENIALITNKTAN